jgi:hypothetical protein
MKTFVSRFRILACPSASDPGSPFRAGTGERFGPTIIRWNAWTCNSHASA